jgi:hypothetical protein
MSPCTSTWLAADGPARTTAHSGARWAAACLALAAAGAASAGPAEFVAVPYVNPGEVVLTFGAGRARARDGSREDAVELGAGWNPGAIWFTAVYAEWSRESAESTRLEAWSWTNQWQLLQATENRPVDVGLLLEIERPQDRSEGYEIRWGPMLQADIGTWQANLNLLIDKSVRADAAGPAQLGYQWQAKTLWQPGIEVGAQGFGEFGHWRHWAEASEQVHQLGPALFGKWAVGNGHSLHLDGAWLVGIGPASPRNTLRMQMRYGF